MTRNDSAGVAAVSAINAREADSVSVIVGSQLARNQQGREAVSSIPSPHRGARPSLNDERRWEHVPHGRGRTITVALGRLDTLLRNGLERVFDRDPRVCLLAGDLADVQLERVVSQLGPRVVVLNELVDDGLLVRLKSRQRSMGILVLAHNPQLLLGTLMLAAGGSCIADSIAAADILAVVHRVAEGERVFIGADGRRVADNHRTDPSRLTRREAQVLEYLSENRSYASIALELRISVATVRTHARAVFRKLGVKSRYELISSTAPAS